MDTPEGIELTSPALDRSDAFKSGRREDARATFMEAAVADEYADFITRPAYERMR